MSTAYSALLAAVIALVSFGCTSDEVTGDEADTDTVGGIIFPSYDTTIADGGGQDLLTGSDGTAEIAALDAVLVDTMDLDGGGLSDGEVTCKPLCVDKQCGPDGCGGTCGECTGGGTCEDGHCLCPFEVCGSACCDEGAVCHEGTCCTPSCLVAECGDDGCGGSCGECIPAEVCVGGHCCMPDCDGKECGPDDCGGVCGTCAAGVACLEGACCTPDCVGKECGEDGCGGYCGSCSVGDTCEAGLCVDDPTAVGCSDGSREGFVSFESYPLIAACGGAWDVPGIHEELPLCGRAAGNTGTNPMGTGCTVTDLCAEGWHVCLGKLDVMYRSDQGCTGIMDNAQGPAFFLARTSSTGAFNCAPDTIGDPSSLNDIFGCGDLGCGMEQGTCTSGAKCVPGVTCATCSPGDECADLSACTPSICYPLDKGSHDTSAALRLMPSCSCDASTQSCSGGGIGCSWCKHLSYWNMALGTSYGDAWDCGSSTTEEAANVVKTDPYALGGVLCCKDQCLVDADCVAPQTCIMSTCQDP